METWFLIALLAPLCFSLTNYADQLITRQYFADSPLNFVVLGGLSSLLVLVPMALVVPQVFDVPLGAVPMILLPGILYFIVLIPYAYALNKEDAGNVLPLFQMIPFFSLLVETMMGGKGFGLTVVWGATLIVGGAIAIGWNYKAKHLPIHPMLLILLSAAICGVYAVVLDSSSHAWPWYKVTFWNLLGWVVAASTCMLVHKNCRQGVVASVRKTKGKVIFYDFAQQALDMLATVFLILAMARAPSATHVMLVGGLQPLFLLVLAVILGRTLPKYYAQEPLDRHFIYKCLGAGVVFYGLYLLQTA